MSGWTWVLADHAGVAIAELACRRTQTYQRNAEPTASPVFSHDDEAALLLEEALRNGIPQLRVLRDGELWASTILTGLAEDAADGSTFAPVFKGPLAILEHRFTDATVEFTDQDAGQIGWDLIAAAHAENPVPIREGAIAATKDRDRVYEHKQVREAIVQLTEVLDGFDFEILPLDPTAAGGMVGEFTVYAEQGQVREDVLFGYGPETLANVQSARRQTKPPINRVRVLGQDGAVAEQEDLASIDRYGLYMVTVSATDVVETDTLNDRARDALRPHPVRVIEFTPDPTLAPQPGTDYWLGDTVSFHARRGSFNDELQVRVNSIEISEDENGGETHTLTIEQSETRDGSGYHRPVKSLAPRLRSVEARLNALERTVT